MLIYEKVQEIDSLLAQIKEEKEQGLNEVKSEVASALESFKVSTSNALESSVNTNLEQLSQANQDKLAEFIKTLQDSNAQVINQTLVDIASVTKIELKEDLSNQIMSHKDEIQGEVLAYLSERVPQELIADIAFNTKILEDIESKVQEQIANRDLSAMIDYAKVQVDLNVLSEEIKSAQSFNTEVKTSLKDIVDAYFSTGAGADILSEIIKKSATEAFNAALKGVEIIQMRFESALRLQSLKIFGTHEMISDMLAKVAKTYQQLKDDEYLEGVVNPQPTINNILVAR